MGNLKLFLRYLYDSRKIAGIFLFFLLVLEAVFVLYRLPAEAVLYGGLLCAAAASVFAGFGFYRYSRAYRQLELMKRSPALWESYFPQTETLLEQEYQELFHLMCEDRRALSSAYDREKRDMTDYYTMWVHQIKTPIAAMRLLLQEREELQASELPSQLFKIEEYVNMVLQYLRIAGGGNDLIIQNCDLDGIVRQAVHKYAGMFVRKKLSLDYHDLNCEVLTDEKWLVFVVEQLLSNAVKYTKQGKITIFMEPGAEKTLVIEDTGIGIAGADLPRIFEKGFTGYNGHTDKRSTGIGLYLCRRILGTLSHTITAESEPGRGTKMKIDLSSYVLRAE